MQISSPQFGYGEPIPRLHTCEGADLSPALEWSGAPEGTQSFVLIVDDPDAPAGVWNHWLLFDIPATVRALPQGARRGLAGIAGRNDFRKNAYGGPCPPRGGGRHRYYFRLYALKVATLGLAEGATRKQIEQAMAGQILAQAEWMGTYERH